MNEPTRQNHYVPEWYQKRFLPSAGASLFYLDLAPAAIEIGPGLHRNVNPVTRRAPRSCFWSKDLYTTWPNGQPNDDVERLLFGDIDNKGAIAVRAFAEGAPDAVHQAFHSFFEYLGAQKMRTPKGLDWIKERYSELGQIGLLTEMQHLLGLNLTLWVEGVREIVSAKNSDVKFILTDHPVTVYNAACPLGGAACTYPNDPDVQWNGSQTVFVLDDENCLILSHLDYAEGRGIDPLADRANARHLGRTLARPDKFIRTRMLSRDEVITVNHLLKSRARRYVAAGNADWLYPEREYSGDWQQIGEVLRPPNDALWGFGGEIYIGYKDGSTSYQDQYGRSSGSHEYLRKEVDASSIEDCDECGCGSGRNFEDCCKAVAPHVRPSWAVASIRERNMIFVNMVADILGLTKGKTWDDIRDELSDEQVVQIHKSLQGLWPPDTNFRELWPRPDSRVFRAVYMGLMDPRTIVSSVLAWVVYFDEIIVLNPFSNPACLNPDYSPIHKPRKFKAQTLKNVLLLFELAPLIEAGIVHFVPDPGELDYTMGHTMRTIAQARSSKLRLSDDDTLVFERLAQDDMKRQFARMPLDVVSDLIRRKSPELDEARLKELALGFRELAADDPLALRQPLDPGEEGAEVSILRMMNLELAMFMAQVMGGIVYTDLPVCWQQLAKVSGRTASLWAPVSSAFATSNISLDADFREGFRRRSSGEFADVRKVFRELQATLVASGSSTAPVQVSQLAADVTAAFASAQGRWAADPPPKSRALDRGLTLSMPEDGIAYIPVQRLVLTFGPSGSLRSVPMAMFVSPI